MPEAFSQYFCHLQISNRAVWMDVIEIKSADTRLVLFTALEITLNQRQLS